MKEKTQSNTTNDAVDTKFEIVSIEDIIADERPLNIIFRTEEEILEEYEYMRKYFS